MYCMYNLILQNTSHAKNKTTKTLPPLQPGDHDIFQGPLKYYIKVRKLSMYAQCCNTSLIAYFCILKIYQKSDNLEWYRHFPAVTKLLEAPS